MTSSGRSARQQQSHAGHVRGGGPASARPDAIGVAWYERQHWDTLRDMFTDGSDFEDTYDEWLEGAEAFEEQLRADGRRVMRVDLEPEVFRRWCESKGLPMNREARSRFAGETAAGLSG